MYASRVREKAKRLRKAGFTHREIAKKLQVGLGSAHLWTKDIAITAEQRQAIMERAKANLFTPERRERQREWAKVNFKKYRERYTAEQLLDKIKNFYKNHGRIPLKREFNMYDEYRRKFGSWNAAIRKAGFEPNPQLFAHRFSAKDGHPCDSFTERLIDDWLDERNIYHERNVPYAGTRMTADFRIAPGILVEFFGLAGVQKKYDELLSKKRLFCEKRDIQLIEIYPKDIFPENQLDKLLLI